MASVVGGELVFRLADPGHDYTKVAVWCDIELGPHLAMDEVDDGWELRVGLPDLDCLEYLFDVDGELIPDAANPDVVDGAFGPHSWVALPGYRPPAWLDVQAAPGERIAFADDVEVWQPAGGVAGVELPLLVVHDGPEMDSYGEVTRYAAALATARPMRVALLTPGSRDERYSANPAYAAELVDELLPALKTAFRTTHKPVLLGQSLGALAALHAAWTSPGVFAGLMLQSGSFFTPTLDPQESAFGYFDRATGFVATVLAARQAAPRSPAVTMTCGTAEENLANNEQLRHHLREVGLAVSWGTVRQGHTWTCWRDCLDPHLTELLRSVWS